MCPNYPNRRRYDVSRRSIRIWPVAGDNESTIWKNTGVFIHEVLCVQSEEMNQDMIESVRRLRSPNPRIKSEVLVVFIDLESRDAVTAYARNLAKHMDLEGNPTAG